MIRNYFRVIHITIEKIIIISTHPLYGVPGTSPEGSRKSPNVWDLQVTFRELLGDQYKKRKK